MIDPKALDALYATLSDIEALNKPVEVIEEQQKTPPQRDALVEELEAQNSQKLSDMYESIMAGAGEFGTGEYKGPTKKQLGLTPKAIVDEGPQDFMVEEKAVTPDILKKQVDLEQELEKLPQIKPKPVVAEQPQPEEDKEQPKAETIEEPVFAEKPKSYYNIFDINLFNPKTRDYGMFQLNEDNLKRIFGDTKDFVNDTYKKGPKKGKKISAEEAKKRGKKANETFKNSFGVYYGKGIENITNITAEELKELFVKDRSEFLELIKNNHDVNLGIAISGSILPNLQK